MTEAGTLLHLLDGKTIQLKGVELGELKEAQLIIGDAAVMTAEMNQIKAGIADQIKSQQSAYDHAVSAAEALMIAEQQRRELEASLTATKAAIEQAEAAERVARIAVQKANALAALETQKLRESHQGLSFTIDDIGTDGMGKVTVVKLGDYSNDGEFLLKHHLDNKSIQVSDVNEDGLDDIIATH